MYKVMLDTCILIDFFLIYSKEDKKQEIPPSLKKTKELLIKFESTGFQNVMSSWGKWELRDVIRRIRLEQKFVELGYSTREFGDAKKEIALTSEEIKLVNDAVFDIWKYCFRETKDFSKEDIRKIERLSKAGFDFMDVVCILQAKKNKCDFFVTRDTKLKIVDKLSNIFGIKIIGLKGYLNKLK